MAAYLFQFRELFYELLNAEPHEGAPLLASWALQNRTILEPYRKFRQLNVLENPYSVERDELWSFYALSRVCDTTLLSFQAGEPWFDLSRQRFVDFWQSLGLEANEPREYHPFWCEIVSCENVADDNAPPRIEEFLWPALIWGDLLICRAGVRLSAGRNWMNAEVASGSPLYFAYMRNYRTADDLSHGWGSNSQWRTDFRRDYVWNELYVFNADGSPDLDEPTFLRDLSARDFVELGARRFFASHFHRWEAGEVGSTEAERESLLVNRCLIDAFITDEDFWPWDDTAIWRQSAPLPKIS